MRSSVLPALAVLASAAATSPLFAQQTLLFVENTRGGDVSVIDDATFKVVGTIDIGLSPDDIVPSPDGKMLYLSRIVRRPQGRPAAPGERSDEGDGEPDTRRRRAGVQHARVGHRAAHISNREIDQSSLRDWRS